MNESAYRLYLCAGPHCTANGRDATERALEDAAAGSGADVELRASGCQSRCESGPNIIIWPGPQRHCHVTPTMAVALIQALTLQPVAETGSPD